MAEFIDMTGACMFEPVTVPGEDGFAAFGKPVPQHRRQAAYDDIRRMGVENAEAAWTVVGQMAENVQRDRPYDAIAAAMKVVDLTGAYRLLAVLCTAEGRS